MQGSQSQLTISCMAAACSLLFCLPMPAQTISGNPSPDQLTKGCWQSKTVQHTPGKCPRQIEQDAFLCLAPSIGGGLGGTLTLSTNKSMVLEGLSPDDFASCMTGNSSDVMSVTMINYDVTVNQNHDGGVELVEVRHKCAVGTCASAPSLRGKLVFAGEVLRWQRTDHVNVEFELAHNEAKPVQ